MTLYLMSKRELDRLEIINQVKAKKLTIVRAAELLYISRRHLHRLIVAFNKNGIKGITSKRRGKPSNRRYPEH